MAALVAAAFQGLYGLMVLASGHDRIWNVPKTAYLDSATGTFVNHNHFAGFLAATLPLGVGLVIAAGRKAAARGPGKTGLIAAVSTEGSRALLLGLLVLTGAAGLLLSFSRAGTALGLAAIAATVAVALRGRAVHRMAAIGILIAIAVVPLLDLGADRLAARYAISREDYLAPGGRLEVARGTLRMVAAFPVAGCGFGAFTEVFPSFASPTIQLHYTHAHNDLLQLGAEGGVAALAMVAILVTALARSVLDTLRGGVDPVLAGAAFGLAALFVHGLVDFNFHIPGNAAIAAVLSGVLFGGSWNVRS
jgi:O-antigen ligase